MKKILVLVSALLILGACAQPTPKDVIYSGHSSESGFDTKITFLASVETQKEFDDYFDLVKKEYVRYNALFDKYNDYEGVNNIKTINDQAGISPVVVDPLIIEMLHLAKEYTDISDGYFDVTFGAVLEIWHEYREEGLVLNADGKPGNVPSMEELEEASQYTGWQYVEIDEAASTVYLTHPRASLDVGAIAKGYATELVALTLEEEGLEHGVVSGGGNIRSIGSKLSGASWNIGVEKPADVLMNDNIEIFSFTESISMVTSGDYQRYYLAEDEKRMSHLINPKTLVPGSEFRSVTIVTPNSTEADALSTAVYVMSYDEALAFMDRYNTAYPDRAIDLLWIADANYEDWEQVDEFSMKYTDGLKDKIMKR